MISKYLEQNVLFELRTTLSLPNLSIPFERKKKEGFVEFGIGVEPIPLAISTSVRTQSGKFGLFNCK